MSFPIVIRDDSAEAERVHARLLAHNGIEERPGSGADPQPYLAGSPAELADQIRPYLELGFGTVIARLPAPYDRATIDRIGEARALLDG